MSTPDRIMNTPVNEPSQIEEETHEEQEQEQEVESQEEERNEEFEIPEKFREKSPEEIAKAYVELERQYGSHANELGATRKELSEMKQTMDKMLQRELDRAATTERGDESEKLEFDYDDPISSIEKILEKKLGDTLDKKLKPIQERVDNDTVEAAQKQLRERHPDVEDVVNDKKFQDWVMDSRVRQELFSRAYHEADFDAANELLDTYKVLNPSKEEKEGEKEEKQQGKQERVKKLSTERGSTGATTSKKWRRADIINLRATNPREYERRAAEIRQAYAEGRVVD